MSGFSRGLVTVSQTCQPYRDEATFWLLRLLLCHLEMISCGLFFRILRSDGSRRGVSPRPRILLRDFLTSFNVNLLRNSCQFPVGGFLLIKCLLQQLCNLGFSEELGIRANGSIC